jgi:hypothetical protein
MTPNRQNNGRCGDVVRDHRLPSPIPKFFTIVTDYGELDKVQKSKKNDQLVHNKFYKI